MKTEPGYLMSRLKPKTPFTEHLLPIFKNEIHRKMFIWLNDESQPGWVVVYNVPLSCFIDYAQPERYGIDLLTFNGLYISFLIIDEHGNPLSGIDTYDDSTAIRERVYYSVGFPHQCMMEDEMAKMMVGKKKKTPRRPHNAQ